MYRYAAFVLALAFVTVLQQSHGTEVNVTDSQGKLCLYANLMVNFSVTYEITGNKNSTAEFQLPAKVISNTSECGATSAMLKLDFGEGHSWSMNFTVSGEAYQADVIAFSYNLGDKTTFPNSASNATSTVSMKPHITGVTMDTCYSCKSNTMFESNSVNQTMWNVLIQAFVSNGSKSDRITSCPADVPTTTVTPTTHAPSTTTAAPVTNATSTAPPTTTPTPTLPTPSVGNYTIKNNETVCLLASFGLRIGIKQGDKYEEMNFETNGTTANGSCGVDSSELELTSPTVVMTFKFTNDSKKFRLHALNISGNTSSGNYKIHTYSNRPVTVLRSKQKSNSSSYVCSFFQGTVFVGGNTNLTLWEASVGSSYMCNKEQNYTISSTLTLFTFDLQVQPFGVKKGVFSTAEDCQSGAESFLVPIAVGVALLVLILIVLLAYFIGRKRNMATGYESF
ncbi:Lysosome-associated membrane glycoprotein 2 [Collichthys lucidus]|uniref:Lysosome-associated membrane glycoprotein 2 n=1 Tax=Collichthys lucidus TaxID=240159 RepID=A0A4U5UCK2_COLLU|nr:Lysosome-associated membrane glycoprotein 2 [Collichthys lucidus]